jgi:hypothetical protein
MYNRRQTKQALGDGLFRYKVRYETEECESYSYSGLRLQQEMLRSVVDSPELILCGQGRFKELKMFHDGLRWVIELQRDEDER